MGTPQRNTNWAAFSETKGETGPNFCHRQTSCAMCKAKANQELVTSDRYRMELSLLQTSSQNNEPFCGCFRGHLQCKPLGGHVLSH